MYPTVEPIDTPDELEELREALRLMQAFDKHKEFHKHEYFNPYPKQRAFFELGTTKRERMFMAGNRVGKSEAGAFEASCHLTGDYPDWWTGKRFDHPTKGWIAGIASTDVRNVAQTKLCGQYGVPSAFGTGMIPKERFADKPTLARGVTDAYDTIQVIHKTAGVEDGVSIASFKSYEQGKDKFQGEDLDWGWADEEPNQEIYAEFLTRINGPGCMFITFTPLLGQTDLVRRFVDGRFPDCAVVQMSLDEAEHFSAEEKEKKLAGYLSYQRDARRFGTPMLGHGRVFPYDEAMLRERFLDYVPPHWVKLWGIDFGIGHPFAAVLMAWDRDNDTIHILQAIKLVSDEQSNQNSHPLFHANAIKNIAAQVPVAWPHDGTQREKGGGGTIASIYKKHGLLMLPNHATHPEGGFGLEASIKEMDDRIRTGRLKVSDHLSDWFEEYRFYHRDEHGQIVKIRDDLISATRIAIMMRRFAQAVPLGGQQRKKRLGTVAQGVDFDIFAT